ncbi:MAG TPA: hypothetical protein VM536_23020 [Chloroflexia bacterium]|nr:hypothetical protein [Chloroflexia bacterium]
MSYVGGRWPQHARTARALGTLLLGSLVLAACAQSTPDSGPSSSTRDGSAARPLQQATPATTPEIPHPPANNATTGGSIGGMQINSVPLGTAPPAAGANPPAAAPATGPGSAPAPAAPAPAAAGNPPSQGRTIPADRLTIRGALVYVGTDGKLLASTAEGKDPRVILNKPGNTGMEGRLTNLSVSPHGDRVIYTTEADSPTPHAYMFDITKGWLSPQKYNGQWAADNHHIVTSAGGKIVVLNVDNGTEDNLGDGTNASWTPDNRIVAVRQGNVWMIPYPATSGTAKQITNFPESGPQSWFFDGVVQYHYSNRVLFTGAPRSTANLDQHPAGLWAWDIPSGKLVALVQPGLAMNQWPAETQRTFAQSPSGLQIAWAGRPCAGERTLGVVSPTGGSPVDVRMTAPAGQAFSVTSLAWRMKSPNDPVLLYSAMPFDCAAGTRVANATEMTYQVDLSTPSAPTPMQPGAWPSWMAPWALGMHNLQTLAQR